LKTGQRGSFPGIYYWFEGDQMWDKSIEATDELGCIGCFWNDPYTWRQKLNDIIVDKN